MDEFKRNYRTGRGILGIVSFIGWIVVAAGALLLALGVIAAVRAGDALGAIPQLSAAAGGLAIVLLGLVGVAAAQHMRASLDVSDMTRALLVLARHRSAGASASPSLNKVGPSMQHANAGPQVEDEVPPMPAHLQSRQTAPSATVPRADTKAEPRAENRAEPQFVASSKSKLVAKPGKVHPIFSARPPR